MKSFFNSKLAIFCAIKRDSTALSFTINELTLMIVHLGMRHA